MNLDKRNKKGETQLHQETLKGNVENVKKLLRDGASPNTVDNAGWSPLHEAVAAGKLYFSLSYVSNMEIFI